MDFLKKSPQKSGWFKRVRKSMGWFRKKSAKVWGGLKENR
jgi:hypothetical protein